MAVFFKLWILNLNFLKSSPVVFHSENKVLNEWSTCIRPSLKFPHVAEIAAAACDDLQDEIRFSLVYPHLSKKC